MPGSWKSQRIPAVNRAGVGQISFPFPSPQDQRGGSSEKCSYSFAGAIEAKLPL